ncbi:MAG: hypothetical protein ACI30W_06070, partial [Muribaculaceae bacterium]
DYREPAAGSVAEATETSSPMTLSGDVLTSRSENIIVYNTSGAPVAATRGCALSVASLPVGVYYAVSNGQTLKFVKQ